MAQPFLGMIMPFCGNFAPSGWALCQGQLLAISSNTALFALLGTQFGGNGTSTFALPDLRGRTILGQGSNFTMGEIAGSSTVTILTQNMPLHNHPVNAQAGPGTQGSPANALLAELGTGKNATQFYAPAPASSPATMNTGMIGMAGGNVPIQVQNPYQVINYVIALRGVFPTRN